MYIARQAIFDRSLKVYGYELLFREGKQSNEFDGVSSVQASAAVLGGLFEAGINQIVDDRRAFVNFDADFICSDAIELIEADRLIIEILEDARVDDKLIGRLLALKEKGYKIALDDLDENCSTYSLLPHADIIKYDIILTPLSKIKDEVKKALSLKKIILAEKVETEEEFIKAKKMGFHLFQGFFFNKPHIIAESVNHTTVNTQYIRILKELRREGASFQSLAEIIEKDANLAYRLVKVTSKQSGKDIIYSIKQALAYMGFKEIERWINVLMLREFNDSKPDELMRISLIRTKFAELIASHSMLKRLKYEASMMGLFSTIDAMINHTMEDALKGTALSSSIKDALINRKGVLSPIYRLILAYETGDWITAEEISKIINIQEDNLYFDYLKAVKWAQASMDAMEN